MVANDLTRFDVAMDSSRGTKAACSMVRQPIIKMVADNRAKMNRVLMTSSFLHLNVFGLSGRANNAHSLYDLAFIIKPIANYVQPHVLEGLYSRSGSVGGVLPFEPNLTEGNGVERVQQAPQAFTAQAFLNRCSEKRARPSSDGDLITLLKR